MRCRFVAVAALALAAAGPAASPLAAKGSYVNFESSHVHPIALTPSGTKLLAVNTPDAVLEVLVVKADGSLKPAAAIPVGLEPVTVRVRTETEAWVVNRLSDSISIVDLTRGTVTRTLLVGDEPSDVAFAAGKAFVAVSQEDLVRVYDLANLAAPPVDVALATRIVRALAVSNDGKTVYAVGLRSGNQTSVVNANAAFGSSFALDPARLAALGINDIKCLTPPPPYPPLPPGITRNPALTDPPDGIPKVGLITRWDDASGKWVDEIGQDWSPCLPFRLPDHDLFAIDTASLAVTTVDHLGTALFEVSVNPVSGKVYVPHTEARNFVRFENPLSLKGHIVDNRMSIVDPASANALTVIDLNSHIDRASNPATNQAERDASVSQPGMMAWAADGKTAYLTAIGSRKLFVMDDAGAFGPNRKTPRAVVVGEGPSGVALLEAKGRAYVLDRFDNAVAVVDTAALTKIAEVKLHDAMDVNLRTARRLLYDGSQSSGHGDAACSSCHLSGDLDGLAWDLGDPTGDLTPYSNLNDNVRFIFPTGGNPVECSPSLCASHQGFDPQKGPMTTQTFRGMLEPLHWRGDRPTFAEFNPAFVGLLGGFDLGPINGKPAGLSAVEMAALRDFVLDITYPPNPFRNVDDTLPNTPVTVPGTGFAGNPTAGLALFDTGNTDGGQSCKSCHAHPFGAAGGVLGGVTPTEPTSPLAAALFNGNSDLSPHNDLKVAHLRNLYDKPGPAFGNATSTPDAVSGFGLIHDGSIPSLLHFFSATVFTLSAPQVKDVSSLVLHFPTGTMPCVGQEVTLPEGAPPTGPPADESRLTTLLSIADATNPNRHGELVATALSGGRMRSWLLSGGMWTTDVTGEPQLATAGLRAAAQGPVTFMCVPAGSGQRLGLDRDEDTHRNGEDCNSADPGAWSAPAPVSVLLLVKRALTHLSWDDQSPTTGPALGYEVVGGSLKALRLGGVVAATACVKGDIAAPAYDDPRANPPADDGWFYLTRARNSCALGGFGLGLGGIDPLDCAGK